MKNKTQNVLTDKDLVSIVKATEEELAVADRRLTQTSQKILDGLFDAGTFSRLVKEGVYQCSTIKVKDQAAYILIHTRSTLGWLIIEGAVSIGGMPLRHLFEGAEALACHLNAPKILFVTKLKGLYEYAKKTGWICMGVIMAKKQ